MSALHQSPFKVLVASLMLCTACCVLASAADERPSGSAFKPGDVSVSSFAGLKLQSEKLKPGVDPIMKTVIDAERTALRIYDGASLGKPLAGQEVTPPVQDYAAKDIGHVFGLAFDTRSGPDAPPAALYAGATSAFGLHITGPDKDADGLPDRLMKGTDGASFMAGLFGAGGGPGTIWQIDQATGKLSRFTDVETGGVKNSGPGLGGLAIDAASGMLYVSDLETGLIHRFSLGTTPADLGQFDHGVSARVTAGKPAVKDDGRRADLSSQAFDTADPKTWGITQIERRVDALAVQQGRLYYSVAEGPEIWSVGLEPDGAFKADARLELGIKSEKGAIVTSIAFDGSGRMIVAERAAQKNPANYESFVEQSPARVLRFSPETPDDPATPGPWKAEPEEYAVGNAPGHRTSDGGLALQHAYNDDGTINQTQCGGTLVVSASTLGPELDAHGLQFSPADAIRTGDALPAKSAYLVLDQDLKDKQARGFAGGVAVLQDCSGAGFPPIASGGGGGGGGDVFPPVTDDTPGPGPIAIGPDEVPVFPPVTDEGTGGGTGGKASLTVTKTASVDKCNPKGGCAFNIEVRNDSPADVAGPIVISEQIEAPQALLTGEPNAPWACTKTAPFTCTHPGPVPAGSVIDMRVVFAPNTPAEMTAVKNCAGLEGGGVPTCATIPLDPAAPAQTGPLILSKKGPATCPRKGPCTFEITLTNASDTPQKTGVSFTDRLDLPGGARLANDVTTPPFTCVQDGEAVACTVDEGLTLQPKEARTVSLPLILDVPAGKTEVRNCVVPGFGSGGKIPPPAEPVPGKKTDLFQRTFGRLIEPASFTPQSFPSRERLLHLTGGAGGNIGGVGAPRTATCNKFLKDGFSINQSNGFPVSFLSLSQSRTGGLSGTAQYIGGDGKPVRGAVSGRISATSFEIVVKWQNGSQGTYRGTIAPDGKATGETSDLQGNKASFTSVAPIKCVEDEACAQYGDVAADQAKRAKDAQCGFPDNGRFALNRQAHVDFCMSRPSVSGDDLVLIDERMARDAAIDICKNKANECVDFGRRGSVLTEQFKALNCPPGPELMSLDGPGLRAACEKSAEHRAFIASSEAVLRQSLDACTAKQAADGGGGAGAGGGTGAGGGVDGAPAPFPENLPAEQCAVVQIEPDEQPGTPAPPLQVSTAGPLSLVKTAGACTAGRSCTFTIRLENTSDQPFQGGAEFADELTGDGALFGASSVTSQAPFACTKQGQGFACKAEGLVIPAKGSIETTMTADLGGGTGAVQVMRNCATLKDAATPSCAEAPLTTAAPQPAPQPGPQAPATLSLSKTATVEKCSDTGGGCAFSVAITNTGTTDFTGPLVFTDVLKTADGKPLDAADFGSVQGVPTDDAKAFFACSKSGAGAIRCEAGATPVLIRAGKSLVIPMTVTPGPAGGATAVRNCAALSGGEEKCANIPLVNGPLLRLRKVTTATSCSPTCAFSIVVQNVGNGDAIGPFTFDDVFTPASVLAIYKREGGGFACGKVQNKFVCTADVNVLKPGETFSGAVSVVTNARAPEYQNCAVLRARDTFQVDTTFPGNCVTVKETDPEPPKLVVRKISTSNGVCDLKGTCPFLITVTNEGKGPFIGSLDLFDGVTQQAPEDIAPLESPDWVCTKTQAVKLECRWRRGTVLEPNQSAVLRVLVKPGAQWKKNDKLENCAFVPRVPGAGACATVVLDPFNVAVEKTGDAACPPGSNCTFKIKLFNPGPINHNAPVTITDGLSPELSAQIVSISPNLPCPVQPTSIPFTCTSAEAVRLDLPPDQGGSPEFGPREYTMVVKMPSDGSGASYSNCVQVSGGNGGEAKACHTFSSAPAPAPLPPVTSEPAPTTPVITTECTGGMVLTGGTCSCPPPAQWNGRKCEFTGGVNTTKQQDATPEAPPPVAPAPAPTTPVSVTECTGGMVLSGGACACPAPARWNGRKCEFTGGINKTQSEDAAPPKQQDQTRPPRPQVCPSNRPIGAYPNCCPLGTEFRRGRCAPVQDASGTGGTNKTKQPCLPGQNRDPRTGVCFSCSHNDVFVNGKCQHKDSQKKLVCPPDRPNGTFPLCCPENAQFSNGQCRCLAGLQFRRGQCVQAQPQPQPQPNIPTKTCPDGTKIFGKFAQCPSTQKPKRDCGPGYRPLDKPNKYGAWCEAIPSTGTCPGGYRGTPPNCVPPKPQYPPCPAGWTGTPGNCKPPQPRPAPVTCPAGKVLSTKGQCVCPSGMRPTKSDPSKCEIVVN